MKNYNTIYPNISGVLTDDSLYFEGIRKPSELFYLKDGEYLGNEKVEILERYLNDLHNLLLKKLSSYVLADNTSEEETTKLLALLQELIKVKQLISGKFLL